MKNESKNNSRLCSDPSDKALARYAAVSWVMERMKETHPNVTRLSSALDYAASRDWNGYHFGTSSVERYYYRYLNDGFSSLNDKKRSDEGAVRKLTDEQLNLLLAERRAHLKMPVTVLLDIMKDSGNDLLESASQTTIYRILREHQLDAASIRNGCQDPLSGPQKAFEMPAVNMVWMTDMMYGPMFKTDEGKLVKSRLFALLDDHSRLCVAAEYFSSESFDCFLTILRSGVLRRGVPEKIYTDQGKVFTCRHLKSICANIGTKLSHARPYHAWSKGKVERFFRTVQQQFQTRLVDKPIHSLEELNERFNVWLDDKYHVAVHSGTGQSPAERFAAGASYIRNPPCAEELEALFMKRLVRRIRRDGCVSVEGKLYEAPLSLRGMNVEVRHRVPLGNFIEIWHQDRLAGTGGLVDKHFNATNFKKRKK